MRLLQLDGNEGLTLTTDLINDIPPYAILSHTWGADGDEVTFQDASQKGGHDKPGYEKILFCGQQAKRDGFDHFWVDTCCIDKTSSAELTKAINSMFRWYREAAVCYVYLTDVSTSAAEQLGSWQRQFEQSRWFTRGWTLQELLAPVSVRFFSPQGDDLGDRKSLQNEIHSITKIPTTALRGTALGQFPTHERLAWAQSRQTTEEEDGAYCLLGIFGVYLPLIYGEGKANAMARLLKEVNQQTSVSGDISGLPYCPPQQEAKQGPYLMIPFGQNEDFVGRQEILTELVVKILPSNKSNDCQRTVLRGLGGVGKTQIALEAAYRVREQDPNCSIFWVPAITMTTFENAYRDIGQALGSPGIEDDKADIKLLVKTALERCSADWLLIIDSVDDIGLLNGEELRKYIPFSRKGSILFTTRNHEVAVELDVSSESTYAISEMNETEALKLLQSGLKARQLQDSQATQALLNHLAYLPLAIKQASAYMAKRRTTTSTYLQYCLDSDETQIKLLNIGFEDRARYSRDTNPIATTWLVSFQHLERKYPLAVEYLKFICFLAEKNIPTSLLPRGENKEEEDEALGILEGYAFISMREQGDAFDIHRLVRLAARNWVKQEWDVALVDPDSHDKLGKYAESAEMHREALQLRKLVLGAKHPDTLESMNNLAMVLDSQGKYEEAEKMHRETLERRKSVLGAEHPDTLRSIMNLANVLYNQGKYEEAEKMHRQTLELKRPVMGPEHPSTLVSMNNLAEVFRSQGKYEEAEKMHRQTLELKKSVMGPEHPSTLASVNNLAEVFRSQGKYEEAEKMHRQTLELKRSVLGPKHPSTLKSMNNLALVFDNQGKYEQAEEIHRQTLELRKSVLGAEHPDALDSMNNLALVLVNQGKTVPSVNFTDKQKSSAAFKSQHS
ncbi:hypothetical protein KJ359_010383 [Pestalotiopsis sp. 9143b]|nr:hypothetical protein KJ359_010383 [Pestalotiopsis sp. 9143b]